MGNSKFGALAAIGLAGAVVTLLYAPVWSETRYGHR